MSSTTSSSEPVITKKGGKGMTHGVVSELSAFLTVKPGHIEELRAAIERFHAGIRNAPFSTKQKAGLQDMRHVIFDDETRVCWITAFDTDWDPYIDDSLDIFGIDRWMDWLQHTDYPLEPTSSNAEVKALLQSAQVRATGFSRTFPDLTVGQIKKAQRLQEAFEKVLDSPEGREALKQPGLEPLLEEAAG